MRTDPRKMTWGITGTDVAMKSAVIILLDDNFASIDATIEEGRSVYDNVRKFLTYILTSNIPELIPYLAFALFKIPLPLTITQILAVDLGTEMVSALGLGVERPEEDSMRRPPRSREERLLYEPLLGRALGASGPALSPSHRGVPQRDHCHADRQRLPVQDKHAQLVP
ncbi:MAG: ATPase, partial [Proteobacteria bacterium]|nr:ATPase [Pseudomonadota bacterium]